MEAKSLIINDVQDISGTDAKTIVKEMKAFKGCPISLVPKCLYTDDNDYPNNYLNAINTALDRTGAIVIIDNAPSITSKFSNKNDISIYYMSSLLLVNRNII